MRASGAQDGEPTGEQPEVGGAGVLRALYTAVHGSREVRHAVEAATSVLAAHVTPGFAVVGPYGSDRGAIIASTLDVASGVDPTIDPSFRRIPVGGTLITALLVDAGVSTDHDELLASLGVMIDGELGHVRAERDLQERVKELQVLRAVQLAVESTSSRAELCRRVCDALVDGMQYPGLTRVDLLVDDVHVSAGRVGEPLFNALRADVMVGGVARGELSVGYTMFRSFLAPEEPDLVAAVARSVGLFVELEEARASTEASVARMRSVLDGLPSMVLTIDQRLEAEVITQGPDFPISRMAGRMGSLEAWDDPGRDLVMPLVRAGLAGIPGRDEVSWRGRWWDVRVEPQGTNGVVDHVLVMILDSTDRVHRRQVESAMSAIIGTSAVALVSIDMGGVVTGWSRGAANLFGWDQDEVLGESLVLLDVDDYDGYTVAEGLRRLHDDRLEEGYVEVLRRHRDGHPVHVGVTMAYIRDAGEKAGALVVYRDLTEREEAREALAASEEQFHLISENIQDVVYRLALDPEPHLDYVSPSVEGVLGLPAEEFVENLSTLTSRVHPEDSVDVDRMIREPSLAAGSFRWRWRHSDGDWVWLEDHRNLITHAGRPVALVGVIRDVTDEQRDIDQTREALEHERRVADELRRVDTMKTTFLSAVSHEVRTPLTSIIGFAETAMRLCDHSDVNQDARSMLDRVMANARRLERLVDDLLDVDRLSRGNVAPRRVPTDLAGLVRRIVSEAERTSHRLSVELEPVVLSVDVSMIERVVDNLVRNAQRHTPDGTSVRIALAAEGSGARIVVEDDGPGIEPSLRELLFEPFEQGESPASSHSPGTGIGLSLVERFVELHGGTVTLDERPGGGARFTIDLPLIT